MKLFIRIVDGQPFEHPVTEETMHMVFPNVDLNNLPSDWSEFVRGQRPALGVYQKYLSQEPAYKLVDGKYTDVWYVVDMTAEEKTAKQQEIKDAWPNHPNFAELVGWIFDEETCRFTAPIPRPSDDLDGTKYFWQGTTMSWVEKPPRPDDGKEYKLDRPTATWVLIN